MKNVPTKDILLFRSCLVSVEYPGVEAVGGIDSQAAICVHTNGTGGLQYYGWAGAYTVENDVTNLTWFALSGATPVEGATNTVTMSFNYTTSPATVTFKVGNTTLTPNPVQLVNNTKTQVAGVSFSGTGSIGEMAGQSAPPAPSTYAVQFFAEDTTTSLFGPTNVAAGTAPVYLGATPTKQATDQYTFYFAGWTNAVCTVPTNLFDAVSAPVNYYAAFTNTVNEYTITFKNYNDAELQSGDVPYGTAPSYTGSAPEKAADGQYTYTWSGWTDGENTYATDATLPAVTGTKTYTATFTPVEKTFTVTWKNYDGTTLETDQNVAYNATPSYDGATPAKAADDQYTYTWTGWDPSPVAVTADAIYTATFSSTVNGYDVTFYTNDVATASWVTNVPYGTAPEYLAPAPTKVADAQYTYYFAGFTNTVATVPTNLFDTVTADVSYYAVFTNTVNQYTVTFENDDNTVLDTQTLAYNASVIYGGEPPAKDGGDQYVYTWTGWTDGENAYATDATLPVVTGAKTYTATYSSLTKVSAPSAASGLVYDGASQTGVSAGTGYSLDGHTATDAGSYTATATLAAGYIWSDETTGAKTIPWSIAPKTVGLNWGATAFNYTGSAQVPTATLTAADIVGNDDVSVSVSGAQTNVGGPYTATATRRDCPL